MKFFTLYPTLCFVLSIGWITTVQGQSENAQLEIDQQIWKPFVASYQSFDHQMFNDLHSDDMLRISSKQILNAADYKKKNTDWFIRAKKEGYLQTIAFSFDQRVVTGDQAFETGYYKIDVVKPDGKELTYFARFHVALQKEKGRWKITQDWDSSELNGRKVSAVDFYQTKISDPEIGSTYSVNLVKVLENRKEETLYYYENNWKKLREEAIRKGYIRSFHLMVNEGSEEQDYDLILLTEYGTPEQFELRETHFDELINARKAAGGGLKLLNETEPKDFRQIVQGVDLKGY